MGVNYYSRAVVSEADVGHHPTEVRVNAPDDAERTDFNWEIYPNGLYNILNRLHLDYQPTRIYVTENGASYADGPDETGRIADERRLNYLKRHFVAAWQAIANDVPPAGYFVWSLLDNFEWAEGYNQRFGIVWMDFETQQRIAKDSALWYKQVIAHNGFRR